MSRIATPATIDAAPASARPLLEAVKKQLGSVPNLFRLVANSPAALEGYLGMSGALAKGSLPAPTRERIALAVAADQRLRLLPVGPQPTWARTWRSSTTPRSPPTATAARTTRRPTPPCASPPRWCASAAMSATTTCRPCAWPATTTRRSSRSSSTSR